MPTYGQTPVVRGGERLLTPRAAELGHRRNLPLTGLVLVLELRPVLLRVLPQVRKRRLPRLERLLVGQRVRPRLLLNRRKLPRFSRVQRPLTRHQNHTGRPCE